MAFNPVHEYSEIRSAERMEKRHPCSKCKAGISLMPPAKDLCFACWSGWTHTKAKWGHGEHPLYRATVERYIADAERRAKKRAAASITQAVS